MENAQNKRSDEELRQEFAEMVSATEKAAAVLARPWKLATVILTVSLAAALLWRKP